MTPTHIISLIIIALAILTYPIYHIIRGFLHKDYYEEVRFLEADELKRSSLREGEEAMTDNIRGGWSIHVPQDMVEGYKKSAEVRSCSDVEVELKKANTDVNMRINKKGVKCWTDKHGEVHSDFIVDALYKMRNLINGRKM